MPNAERGHERVRTGLLVVAVLVLAAGLASSLPQTAKHAVAARTYRPSAWPGLIATPAAPVPVSGAPAPALQGTSVVAPSSPCGATGASAQAPSAPPPASGAAPPPAAPPPATTSAYRRPSSDATTGSSAGGGPATGAPRVSLMVDSRAAPTARLVDTVPTTPPPTLPSLPSTNLAPGASSSVGNVIQGLIGGGATSASNPGLPGALPAAPAPAPAPLPAPAPAMSTPQAAPPPPPAPQPNPYGPLMVAAFASGAFGDSPLGSSSNIGCQLVGLHQVGAAAPGETPAQAGAVQAAMGLLGTPYVWGGESRSGFDCSGLVQYSFDTVGVSLPRVAQDQYDAGPAVPPGSPAVPGDLVFFGSGPQSVEHVGIFAGNGIMIDAPHTGSVVRYDRIDGFMPIVGITSPGGQQIA